jgi:hypothetical protein
MKQILIIIASLFLLTSCEKEIDLNLEDKSGNIVIEGNVTNGPGPYYVRVTRSVAFTEANQYPGVANASVVISDNTGQADTLEYVSEGLYKTGHLVATPGNTYTLQVTAGGQKYTAQSTMPQPVVLDSLKQGSFSFGGETNYNVRPVFTDPSPLGNRYLFIVSVNGSKRKALETFSDNFNNGLVNQRNLRLPMDNEDSVKIGDTIHVEMQCIDQNIYTYYNAVIQISGDDGSGAGITPANPPSNINNSALGYFSAHTFTVSSIVIK